jgi:hypothetical protein
VKARDVVTLSVAVVIVGGALLVSFLETGWGLAPSAGSTPLATQTAVSVPSPSLSAPSTARRVNAGSLDPATLPVRSVGQALFVARFFGADGTPGGLLMVDAASGDWVRSDLASPPLGSLLLSPDGRSLVRTRWAPAAIGGFLKVELVELGTGAVREVPVAEPEDCSLDAVAWAPDGRHLAVVSACFTADASPSEPRAETSLQATFATFVQEVELATGKSHVVERVPDSSPCEAFPSYSPDGRLLAYGIGHASDDEEDLCSVRVTPVQGGTPREWKNVHLVYGDPWRDPTTLLVWDELAGVGTADSHVLLFTATGERTPYGIDRLTNLKGFVAGTLLAEKTNWLRQPDPCPVALCTVDLGTGVVAPWLTLPTGMLIGDVSPARTLLAG